MASALPGSVRRSSAPSHRPAKITASQDHHQTRTRCETRRCDGRRGRADRPSPVHHRARSELARRVELISSISGSRFATRGRPDRLGRRRVGSSPFSSRNAPRRGPPQPGRIQPQIGLGFQRRAALRSRTHGDFALGLFAQHRHHAFVHRPPLQGGGGIRNLVRLRAPVHPRLRRLARQIDPAALAAVARRSSRYHGLGGRALASGLRVHQTGRLHPQRPLRPLARSETRHDRSSNIAHRVPLPEWHHRCTSYCASQFGQTSRIRPAPARSLYFPVVVVATIPPSPSLCGK